jgi:hypothetical protein
MDNTTTIKNIKILLVTIGVVFSLASCQKEEEQAATPAPAASSTPSTTAPTPNFGAMGPAAVCYSIKSFVDIPSVAGIELPPIELGIAGASFWDVNSSTLVDAGLVTCNEKVLTKADNNGYIFTPSATEINGIDFQFGSFWEVSGAGTVDPITYNYTEPVPLTDELVIAETVSKSNPLLVSVGTVVYSDSVQFQLSDNDGHVLYYSAGPNVGSHTFSADQMATLTTGQMSVVVAPYNYLGEFLNGRTVYFVNLTARTKIVTLE